MSDERVIVILNRTAGRGRAARAEVALRSGLEAAGFAFEIRPTKCAGDGVRAARSALRSGATAVVAAGGDGTVNEVVEGLHGQGAPPDAPALAILPLGSGDDFAAAVGAPRDAVELVRAIRSGGRRRVDLGNVHWVDGSGGGRRVFCNGIGLGLEAEADLRAERLRFLRGLPLYATAVAWALLRPPRPLLRLAWRSLDGPSEEERRRCLLVAVGNGHRAGGGFRINPGALPDDGLLDLCIVGARSRWASLRALPGVLEGTHLSESGVRAARCTDLEVESEEPFALHADGEVLARAATRVEVSVIPGALNLVART